MTRVDSVVYEDRLPLVLRTFQDNLDLLSVTGDL